MKNVKITYAWTRNEDDSKPDNNYNEETFSIVVEPPYEFGDWLSDGGVEYEREGNRYCIVEYGERTGEVYWVLREEETDEDLRG